MNIDEIIRKNAFLFSLLLSGGSFVGLYTKTGDCFTAALCAIAVLMILPFVIFLCGRVNFYKENERQISFLNFPVFVFAILIYASYTAEFVQMQKTLSDKFSGGRFSALFVILSLVLALYMGKRELTSLSRICFLLLPVLVFPHIITAFDFLGHRLEIQNLIPESTRLFDIKYFLFPISSFCSVLFLLPLVEERVDFDSKRSIKGYIFSFFIIAAFCVLEYMKYLLWFGKEGLVFVDRPDRTMLSQVPYMNVQEIFLVSYYTAYMLKISLFCTCARKCFEKQLSGAKIKKDISVRGGYFATFICGLIAYFILPAGDGFHIMSSVAVGGVFISFLLSGIIKRLCAARKPTVSGKSL